MNDTLKKILTGSLLSSLAMTAPAFAKTKSAPKQNKSTQTASAMPTSGGETLNDSWYTMQAGSTPWGYFHEIIQKKDGKYYYRYDMTKQEGGKVMQENIGAIATEDLTPVAFNLNKVAEGNVLTTDGTFEKSGSGGILTVNVGGRPVKRSVSKPTILEVFFPVWVHQNWSKLKSGFSSSVSLFAEDPTSSNYMAKTAHFTVNGDRNKNGQTCKELQVELDHKPSVWCLTSTGALVDMVIGKSEALVKKVANESAAKAFITQE